MFYGLKARLQRGWHNLRCAEIYDTPPILGHGDGLAFVSMVSHADVIMYLVAIKSLYSRIGQGRIVIINDGSLTEADVVRLNRHLNFPQIIALENIQTGPCPRGGCWERLLTIMDICGDHYVIQMDSDTLTLDSVPEVIDAIQNNRSFALGTHDGQRIVSLAEAQAFVENHPSQHVQIIAEQNFGHIEGENLRYIRGCAGFSGFAKGLFRREDAEAWSQRLQSLIGEKWLNWGSEQVTSNLLIANVEGSEVLPYPRYGNFSPSLDLAESAFVHFIGTHRFSGGVYRAESRNVIAQLLERRN